jgi:type II secretory pathway pseudopilin PulG
MRTGDDWQAGFTLLAVLFMVAALGVGLAALGHVWETHARREKEAELLFVGHQYRRAIEAYYLATPGPDRTYPKSLEDLLLDRRFPQVVRHLRRLYPDPITGKGEWGLVKEGQGIKGVHSLSADKPLKQAGFDAADKAFEGKAAYSDWKFVAFVGNTQ